VLLASFVLFAIFSKPKTRFSGLKPPSQWVWGSGREVAEKKTRF